MCIWNEARAESPTRLSNEWLKDEVLMDFLHASKLGSEHLLQEAARNEISGHDTFEDFRSEIVHLVNSGYAEGTPEPAFLEYVPSPRNRDEQGMLIALYLHLFHCREYWQGSEATEVPTHDDSLSDLSECYWQKFRIENIPLPRGSTDEMQTAYRTDFVSVSQVDAVFRSPVYRFRDMTPDMVADSIKSSERMSGAWLAERLGHSYDKDPFCS